MSTLRVPQSRARHAVPLIVRLVLPLVLVVPTAVLFALLRQSTGDDVGFTTAERHGIAYLQVLGPLEIALTNAQSAAVTGAPVARASLVAALDATSKADDAYGAELRTHDRWLELRSKIESLPPTGTPEELFTAYGGTTDLLLALIDKVRNNSNLVRDPQADTYYLEDGAAQELPEAIVAATRYTSLAARAVGLDASGQASLLVDITAARSDLASNAQDLSEDVQLASQGSGSQSLGITLLSKIDTFNRAIDALIPSTSLIAGKALAVDITQVVKARGEVQSAAADLSASLLIQIDDLLDSRLADLGLRQNGAFVTLTVAVLLGLVIPVSWAVSALRRRWPGHDRTPEALPAGPAPVEDVPPVPDGDPRAAARRWPAEPPSDPQYDMWERSRAAR